MRSMERTVREPERAVVAGLTAREIAKGTGMSLATVYRALHGLQQKGLIIRQHTEPRRPEAGRHLHV
jgi:DNA-binding IclR family transcriptional regulator